MKIFKKITALAMAAVAASALSLSAAAEGEHRDWSVAHVNTLGAPSILNYTTVYMMASRDTYYAMAEHMTDLVSRKVTITSDTNQMSRNIEFNATGREQSWRLLSGDFNEDVTYTITAHTNETAILAASGYIERRY